MTVSRPVVTDYGFDDLDSISGRSNDFLLILHIQTVSGAHPASYPTGTGEQLPPGYTGRDLKLTTYFHLVPRSRKSGAIPPVLNMYS
jgi:hypothetical protein